MKILIYAYGNPGRQDDGLGIFLCDELQKWAAEKKQENLTFDSNYQLNAEDALLASEHEAVIFIDAAKEQDEPFKFREIKPAKSIAFSTHSMSPESVMALCEELYGKTPGAYILTIKGYMWEVNGLITPEAAANMEKALEFMKIRLAGS